MNREVIRHEDGVYLGLAQEGYLRDDALGSGALRYLKDDPPEWWWDSPLNMLVPPVVEPREARGRFVGTASHVLMLEGQDVYEAAYGVMPSLADHPDALQGLRALQGKAKEMGLSAGGTMEEIADRIHRLDASVEILLILQQAWMREGKLALSFGEDAVIRLLHRMAMRSPEEIELAGGERLSLLEAFRGGLSEVSVFWTDENGIRMRARFDKLKMNAIVDWKTIGRPLRDFRRSLLYEIVNRGYRYQPPHYNEARRQLPRLLAEGRVYGGNASDREYLEECARQEEWSWVFVFGKTAGSPQVRGIRIDEHDTVYVNAARDREDALTNFLYYREIFGLEAQWFDPQVIWKPEDQDWPLFSAVE